MAMVCVILMFVVPAAIALKGMFGDDFMKVIRGESEDRVKYVRDAKTPPPPSAAGVAPEAKA
ncbi:MAG: hypothetical protein AAFT19_10400 [Pseudomonadota bacterium]